jgi:outer membrane protein assembly factor BamD
MMQIKKYFQINLAIAIIVPLLIASCNSDAPVMERPEKVYYDTAQRRMKANNFYSAIESLEAIEARYPFGRYAEQAQSELIYAYYMNGEDEASHEAAEKFIRLNPRHPNIDYAYFMRGYCKLHQGQGNVYKNI